MRRICVWLCLLSAVFAVTLLFSAPALAEENGVDVVLIVDWADTPPEAEDAPWLAWPCMNPEHRYYKPLETQGRAGDTFPGGGEPDTTVRYGLIRRFLLEAGARGWRPWENHYQYKNGAWYPIADPAAAGCYGREETARSAAEAIMGGLMENSGGVRIGLIAVGPPGDARWDCGLTGEKEPLLFALADMPCQVVRDRSGALIRAAAMLNRRRGEEAERPAFAVLLSGGESDRGPYEWRARAAAALLTGEKGEASPVLWWTGLGEVESRGGGAQLILLGISEGRDGLFCALQKKGAPRFSLFAGEEAGAIADEIVDWIRTRG